MLQSLIRHQANFTDFSGLHFGEKEEKFGYC